MIKFNQISKGLSDYDSSNNVLKIISEPNGRVYSPYEGIVVTNYSDKCKSGYLLIQHKIQNSTYYSEFCNIGKVVVRKNDTVVKGSIIGYGLTSDDEITYRLLNDKLKKINPMLFFKGFESKTQTSGTNKNWENLFNQKPVKKEKTKKSYRDDNPQEKKKSKSIYDYSLLDLALTPFNLLKKGGEHVGQTFKDAKKGIFDFSITKKDNEESINEEIKKIKKLL